MASEAPVVAPAVEHTTDELVEKKKVIDSVKNVEEENTPETKQIGGNYEVEKLEVEESASSETAITESEEQTANKKVEQVDELIKEDDTSAPLVPENKDDGHAVEGVKEEESKASASDFEVSDCKEEDAPSTQDVKESSGSEILEGKKNDAPTLKEVRREVEDGKAPSSVELANEVDGKAPRENTSSCPEASSDVVEKPLKGLEVSPIKDSEQVAVPEVLEPVVAIAKSLEGPVDISADPTSVSETVETVSVPDEQPAVPVGKEHSSDVTVEVNSQSEAPEVSESADTSKDERILTEEVETSPEPKEKEADLKETASLDADSEKLKDRINSEVKDTEGGTAVSEKVEKAEADATTVGSTKQSVDEESGSDLVKDVAADTSVPNPSTTIGALETIDTVSVTELSESMVKSEVKAEEEKQEKTVKTDEETPSDAKKTEGLGSSDSATEVNVTSSDKEKPFDGVEKVVEEQNMSGSTSANEVAELSSEKGDASEVVGEKKDKSVNDDTTVVVETPRDINLGAETVETISVESEETKLEVKPEETMQTAEQLEKDKWEEKKDETEKPDVQSSIESSKDDVVLKTDVGVQKSEVPAKPTQRHSNNIISKVKHSIGKVKKAIIGKSPSSKTMSSEAKDESKAK